MAQKIKNLEGASVVITENGGRVYCGLITRETDDFIEFDKVPGGDESDICGNVTRVILNKKGIKRIEVLEKSEEEHSIVYTTKVGK